MKNCDPEALRICSIYAQGRVSFSQRLSDRLITKSLTVSPELFMKPLEQPLWNVKESLHLFTTDVFGYWLTALVDRLVDHPVTYQSLITSTMQLVTHTMIFRDAVTHNNCAVYWELLYQCSIIYKWSRLFGKHIFPGGFGNILVFKRSISWHAALSAHLPQRPKTPCNGKAASPGI